MPGFEKLSLASALAAAIAGSLVADVLWYSVGRRYGSRVLGLICRLSADPEACVPHAKRLFFARRIKAFLFGKFFLEIADAQTCFRQALDLAKGQGALAWELLSARSLARLHHRQGRAAQARKAPAPVYHRFTEGFKTADRVVAKMLLDTLR